MRWGICAVLAVLPLFAGCSIYPLPEDVTGGVKTPDIVRQIRCETREAAIEALVNWLESLGRDHPSQRGVPLARELAAKYKADPNTISEFHAGLFKGPEYHQVRNVINIFYSIGVAYNFELTMTEDNDLSAGSANLQSTSPNSIFKLGVGAGVARRRANNRIFTITDTFSYLLTTLNTKVKNGRRDCDRYIVAENYVYPIAGHVGVNKMVYDFLDLTLFEHLGGKTTPSGPPTMADKLTFTTTLDVSATPKITFTPTGSAFQFTDAGLTAELKRTDTHEVTFALALPTEAAAYLNSLRTYVFTPTQNVTVERIKPRTSGAKGTTSLVVGTRVMGGGTPAEALAVYAVDQLKSRQIQLVSSP